MNYLDFFEVIKSANLSGMYLIHGEEEFVKEQALARSIESFRQKGNSDFNLHILDGEKTDYNDIINICKLAPFLGSGQLVIIKDFHLTSGKKSFEGMDKFLSNLTSVSPELCLIFFYQSRCVADNPVYKSVKKYGDIIEFPYLKPEEKLKWLTGMLRKNSKAMDRASMLYLINITGNNLTVLNNEVLKLISFTGENAQITSEDINEIVVKNYEYSSFKLIDLIARKDIKSSLSLLESLIIAGESIMSIISILSKQMRTMLICSYYKSEGLTDSKIAQKLTGHPYAVKKSIEQSNLFTLKHLKSAVKECLNTDYSIKSGKIKDKAAIELLILKLMENKKMQTN